GDVVHVERGRGEHAQPGQVGGRPRHLLIRRGRDQQDAAALLRRRRPAEPAHQTGQNFRLGRLQVQPVEHGELPRGRPGRQRRTERQAAHPLGEPVPVVPGGRPEDDSAPDEQRRAAASVPGAAGPFLPVQLPGAPVDQPAGQRRVRSPTASGELPDQRFVEHRRVRLGLQHRGQRDLTDLLALGVVDRHHAHARPPAFLTSTRLPRGPGSAPRIKITFRSGSTETTESPRTVERAPPRRPGARVPGSTLATLLMPTLPTARCIRLFPWESRCPPKLCRFIAPANPLPLLTPTTSTRSPLANTSALIDCPTSACSPCARRTSRITRWGLSPLRANTPRAGLLILPSATSPNPNWTAAYPSRSWVRTAPTRQGPASTTVTGTTLPASSKTWVMPSFLPSSAGIVAHSTPASTLILISTPAGRSRCMSASTVLDVGSRISIRRLYVRSSKCSIDSLSMCGERMTQYRLRSMGSGTGPEMRAPVRLTVSTIFSADWSRTL